jgi:uncharacterized glyoxalase superfamily protein PhnB
MSHSSKAFGLPTQISYGTNYGEVETGSATLAFASYDAGQSHLPRGLRPGRSTDMSFEVALLTESVEEDFRRAVDAGAVPLFEPSARPWGQTVSYLRCRDGTVVELSTPVAAQ